MQIHGLNKTTLLDYPGHVAATVFTGGCNFCCPFCQNKDLVLNPNALPTIAMEDIFSFLSKRKNVLSGVCITGGEPTLQKDLISFISQIKDLGYLVKLDTNGSNPAVVKELLSQQLVDYIAMDIKSGKSDYDKVAGCQNLVLSNIDKTIDLLKTTAVSHEFRTTAVKGLHNKNSFQEIADWLCGASPYFIQSYRESEGVIQKGFSSFSKEELASFLSIIKEKLPNSFIRGVD